MIVRDAREADIPALLVLGRMFFAESEMSRIAPWDDDGMTDTFRRVMRDGALLVAERDGELIGGIGAVFFPAFWSPSVLLAQELFWYVHPDERGGAGLRLYQRLKDVARECGVQRLFMVTLAGVNNEAVERLYLRDGLAPMESMYWRAL